MRLMLTGGAGYVGSACLRGLLRGGHYPVAFDNLSQGNASSVPEGLLEVGDIEDSRGVVEAMQKHGAEAVMHFAAVASVPESIVDPENYWRTNVIGTKNVLDAMLKTGVKRIVFSSTAAVYSPEAPQPVCESALTLPRTPYGTTKLAAERLIGDYSAAYGIGYSILRYFNASGADPDAEFGEDRMDESHLIPLICEAALAGQGIKVYGDNWDTPDRSCIRDYVHTEDLMRAHLLALEHIEPGKGTIYNVGSNQGSSVFQVLEHCRRVIGEPIRYEICERRPGDTGVLIADAEKLRNELGWRAQYDLPSIVESAWRWHNRYPKGYASKLKGG